MLRKLLSFVAVWALVVPVLSAPAVASSESELQLEWAEAVGSSGLDFGFAVDVDTAGNTYVAGSFQGSADFDHGPGEVILTSNGNSDAFVAVYNPANDLMWAYNIGDSSFDDAYAVASDTAGNTHVSGRFSGTADFDPGPGETLLTSTGSTAFVAVYDLTGGLIWVHSIDSIFGTRADGIATDAAGNTHVVGSFSSTVDFDPGPGETLLTASGTSDPFVAVYDPTGALIRAVSIDSSGSARASHVATDAAGNTHVIGDFEGDADFDPGPNEMLLTSEGSADMFVAVYDTTGALIWAHNIGSTRFDIGRGIATDLSGNTHVTGSFQGEADFDPSPTEFRLAPEGGSDIFVAVYDPAGALIHAIDVGGTNTDIGTGIATDSDGNSHVTGYFKGLTDFDPGAAEKILSATGNWDIFVAVYDPAGGLINAIKIGGPGFDEGFGIATDSSGATHVTGYFELLADFDPATSTTRLFAAGDSDIFVARYALTPALVLFCNGQVVTIDMNQAGATGIGTASDDVILGTPGNDVIDGRGGNDTICGGTGDDRIDGGDGLDFIFGGEGNDTMNGGEGNDRIRGQQDIDTINGEGGNDFLFGGTGNDQIDGGDGRDTIGGFGGADTINAGPGNDIVFGGFGADTIDGGAGNDELRGLIGNDIINGGSGNDEIYGDNGQDTLNGNDGDDVLNGGNSLDTINGNDGNDILNGGKSDDSLSGDNGTDVCTGNRGTDTASVTCETTFGIP